MIEQVESESTRTWLVMDSVSVLLELFLFAIIEITGAPRLSTLTRPRVTVLFRLCLLVLTL